VIDLTVTQDINLKPFTLKENSWIYHTAADYSDVLAPGDQPTPETFVIKLGKDGGWHCYSIALIKLISVFRFFDLWDNV